jgi:HTH-type transcriptional regulator/antitoxin HipB
MSVTVSAIIRSPEDLGAIVASVRKVHGLTQRQLAERLHVSQRYVSELELGRPKIADERYFRLLALLGIKFRAEIDSA